MNKRTIAAVLGAAALLVPSAASAHKDSGSHGKGKGAEKVSAKHVKKQAKKDKKAAKAKKAVAFVFKGVYAGDGVVSVKSGNAHVRKGGYVGTDVRFDMASAKIVAAEFDNVAGLSAGDLQVGDSVLVKARQARGTKAPAAATEGAEVETAAAIKAIKVVDKTHPKSDDDDADDAPEVESEDEQEDVPAP